MQGALEPILAALLGGSVMDAGSVPPGVEAAPEPSCRPWRRMCMATSGCYIHVWTLFVDKLWVSGTVLFVAGWVLVAVPPSSSSLLFGGSFACMQGSCASLLGVGCPWCAFCLMHMCSVSSTEGCPYK